ncbi:MAG TPA: hypothetical protein PKE69_08380 [Pyrinomonadaceae bacterium]|nr:hypothetical protein [Pyrinomonadaceae bacterium]
MDIQTEWNVKGAEYAQAVNKMVEFGEQFGWENWKGEEPIDDRIHLADSVLEKLREANKTNEIKVFRNLYPPSHAPFAEKLNANGQFIGNLCYVSDDTIALVIGASYQEKKAFVLENYKVEQLPENIIAIGKSPQGNCFAIATDENIITYSGWQGVELFKFEYPGNEKLPITQLLPYNDGSKVLLVSSEGIFCLSQNGSELIHPVKDVTDEEWTSSIDMEHAALSPDNKLVCVGDQCSNHRILDNYFTEIGDIYPESSYPHFTLFSKDGTHLIMNACHFYNGTTIGVLVEDVADLSDDDERKTIIDDECRVYSGVAVENYYILGDAYGYIRAFDKAGNKLWRHFLGSTISGMTVSDDESTLFVGTYAGILHKIKLGKEIRDNHTISNGNNFEEFRILFWKDEKQPLIW